MAEAIEVKTYWFSQGEWSQVMGHLPTEMELAIYVNTQELVSILCTPNKLEYLVLGYLYTEGIIKTYSDLESLQICEKESFADARLKEKDFQIPGQRVLTSGCGGGSGLKAELRPVESNLVISPDRVFYLTRRLTERMDLYRLSGGVHTSALADKKDIIITAVDIGRHNTIDKIQGECLVKEIRGNDKVLLTTGRISSEMIIKAAAMGVPVVVSRHSPTQRAVDLAQRANITVVGYVRANRLVVYSHPERLGFQDSGSSFEERAATLAP